MLNTSMNIQGKKFGIIHFRDTCSSFEILKGYMLICWNAVGVHPHLSEC